MDGDQTESNVTQGDPDVTSDSQGNGSTGTTSTPSNFEEWYGTQDQTVKSVVDGHVVKLKNALESERERAGKLKGQLADLKKAVEKGSELEGQIGRLQEELTLTQRRSDFYEEAPADLENPRLAWMLATADNLFDEQGHADWEKIRKQAPQIFVTKKTPAGGAGAGRGSTTPAANMNTLIRQAAGKR